MAALPNAPHLALRVLRGWCPSSFPVVRINFNFLPVHCFMRLHGSWESAPQRGTDKVSVHVSRFGSDLRSWFIQHSVLEGASAFLLVVFRFWGFGRRNPANWIRAVLGFW